MKIFINPGHDPQLDPGACGNGLREADVVLNIGRRVENYLRAVGYDVKLFQYDGLGEICFDANAWKADLFVSIHCNAATGNAKGTETFSSGGAKSTRLATCIQNQLVNSLPVVNRGVKTAGYYVLKNTDAPAVLVETAFIDNPNDAKLLLEREDDFARAIARGVTDYFQNEKPLPDVIDAPKTSKALGSHFNASEFVCHCCGQIMLKSAASRILSTCWGRRLTLQFPKSALSVRVNWLKVWTSTALAFIRLWTAAARGSFMLTFVTVVSAHISNGGIDMWQVNKLVAIDQNNYIVVENGKIVISTSMDSGRIYRNFELNETPPCLTVAVNDLIKLLTDEEQNST